jgi:lipopolysaccharide transport system ATP-binding protein
MESGSDPARAEEAIVVHNLVKRFKIPHEQKNTIFAHIFGLLRGGSFSYEEFVALNEISFSIATGETFGIIGPNGSGKSTLLKILAGIIYPDSGTVAIHGKIAPFIELGVGFHPELTGRENVFLYGAIMGVKKKELRERYEDIIAFADLKKFEDMRLKHFSSGMTLRLAFSTAIQTNPDILLVDEILSVGDAEFQQKCNEKIAQLKEDNKTIVYVSHNMDTVKRLTNRCLLLEKGKIVQIGDTPGVIETYQKGRERQNDGVKHGYQA